MEGQGGIVNGGADITDEDGCGLEKIDIDMFEMDGSPKNLEPRSDISEPRADIVDAQEEKKAASQSCCSEPRFDCIERRLRVLFAAWGRVISRYPWPAFFLPILLTLALSYGFIFFVVEIDQEVLYTPIHGRAKTERRIVEDLFSTVASESHTMPARLTRTGRFVHVIFTKTDGGSVLSSDVFEKAAIIHDKILTEIKVHEEEETYSYQDLCIMWNNNCLENTVLALYGDNPEYFSTENLTYPYMTLPDGSVAFTGAEIGGVELWMNEEGLEPDFSAVRTAKAFRLIYYLRSESQFNLRSATFESLAVKAVKDVSREWDDVSALPFASRTPDDEVKASTLQVMILFPAAGVLLLVFTVGSCLTKDSVRGKPWLAIAAMVSTLLAMLSAPGLLFFFGVPFVDMAAAMPFVILGRGLDDAFIMLAAWRQTNTKFSVEQRMSLTLADAVMSITATTVTDTLAYMIGAVSDFLSVRIFCLWTGVAVIFDFIYQVTFFAACMVFSGNREAAGRHCITLRRVDSSKSSVVDSHESGIDVSESVIDSKPSSANPAAKKETDPVNGDGKGNNDDGNDGQIDHAFMTFFREYFGPFILHPFMIFVIFIVYIGYIGGAIWGCLHIDTSLPEQHFVRENSDAFRFLDLKYEYLTTYEPPVSLVIETEQNYWEEETQQIIKRTLEQLEQNPLFHDSNLTISWLHEYNRYLKLVGISDMTKDLFITVLREQFLKIPVFESFALDIVFDETNSSIISSRFFVIGNDLQDSHDQEAMMLHARSVARNCEIPAIAYSPAFVLFDQYVTVIPSTIQNMVLAIVSIIFASFLLIPSVTCCVWVTIAVVSILTGVVGYMTLWDVNLHSLSLLTLILSVGFSVDFTVHITSSFVSSQAGSRKDRAIHALYAVGMPIVQGSVSTFFAIFLLAFSAHYVFRVFFKSLTLVISFGLLHGIVFLPVILSILGPKNGSKSVVPTSPTNSHKYTTESAYVVPATLTNTDESKTDKQNASGVLPDDDDANKLRDSTLTYTD